MDRFNIKKIAIFRALQLGDMLCSIPALSALRILFPHARIVLISLPWTKELTIRYPELIDEELIFPGFPGLPEQVADMAKLPFFLKEMQNEAFDLLIQLHGSGSITNPLIMSMGAKQLAGFFTDQHFCPPGIFVRYPTSLHEIHRLLQPIIALGAMSTSDALHFPIWESDWVELSAAGLIFERDRYVCIHPGARDPFRRWPAPYFAAVADALAADGYSIVLTGSCDEIECIQEVVSFMHYTPIIAAGKTRLGSMAALIDRSAMLISNCTGVSHLAVAVQKRSVVISLEKEPWRWSPLDTSRHLTITVPPKRKVGEVIGKVSTLLRMPLAADK